MGREGGIDFDELGFRDGTRGSDGESRGGRDVLCERPMRRGMSEERRSSAKGMGERVKNRRRNRRTFSDPKDHQILKFDDRRVWTQVLRSTSNAAHGGGTSKSFESWRRGRVAVEVRSDLEGLSSRTVGCVVIDDLRNEREIMR